MKLFTRTMSVVLAAIATWPAAAMGTSEAPAAAHLRPLIDQKGISLGAAVRPEYLDDEDYVRTLQQNFNILVPENDLKWEMIRLSPTTFDFSSVDILADFAAENGMVMRGHTLVWHQQNPGWLRDFQGDKAAWAKLLDDHIATVVGHYKGKIRDWDVVNEVVDDSGKLRDTLWLRALGPDYIAQAFVAARRADPAARLFINDYSTEMPGPKSDFLYQLVKGLLSRGVPIDGVGFQCHLDGSQLPDFSAMGANFKRFADLGLEVEITELDVRMPGTLTTVDKERQATIYAGVLDALIRQGHGKTCVVWGVSDRHSWVPMFFQGYGEALLFDRTYQAKSGVTAIAKLLSSE